MAAMGVLTLLLALAVVLAARAWKRTRPSPAELERRRRAELDAKGKLGDATLVEIRDHLLFYSYDVRGVEYTASQDVSVLLELLPAEADAVNGVVYVKYDARNPANSIILSEQWSGLGHFGHEVHEAGASSQARGPRYHR
jgi:hypothetical protein